MKDAFAGPVDIALDGAVGRGRDRAGCRRQQDRLGTLRRLDGAENGGLLVADAPVPRRDERALPHPGLGLARGLLVALVIVRDPRERQRPAVRHQPFLDVLAVGLAARHYAAAAIRNGPGMTGPALSTEAFCQFVARGGAAGPALALGVEAELIGGRRVDAAQTDAVVADLEMIAFTDFRDTGDVGRLRDGGERQQQNSVQQFLQFHRQSQRNDTDSADNGAVLPVS